MKPTESRPKSTGWKHCKTDTEVSASIYNDLRGPELRIHRKRYDFPNLSKTNHQIRDLADGRRSIMSRLS
jgi:hypothetical protein